MLHVIHLASRGTGPEPLQSTLGAALGIIIERECRNMIMDRRPENQLLTVVLSQQVLRRDQKSESKIIASACAFLMKK
jgi:hypothetical protein